MGKSLLSRKNTTDKKTVSFDSTLPMYPKNPTRELIHCVEAAIEPFSKIKTALGKVNEGPNFSPQPWYGQTPRLQPPETGGLVRQLSAIGGRVG